MDIFSPHCCEVSASRGTLVISVWVNYRLLGNFTAATSVWLHLCVENTCVWRAMEKDLERITFSEKTLTSKGIECCN